MKAIQGGTATHDTIEAQNIAVLLRGGMWPQADVYRAAMRATRDLLRRRLPLRRTRAERLAHIQNTNRQYNLAELGKTLADQANRAGVAERFPEPAGQKSIQVDLALIDHDAHLLRDRERTVLTTATPHTTTTLDLRRTVPGIGEILRLVRLDDIHDRHRFPRVQAGVSDCRLVNCAREAAGKRYGSSGTKSGHASRTWAVSDAAVLFLRGHPAGQQDLARVENTHRQGNAFTVLAHTLARAVYDRLRRQTACEMRMFLHVEKSGADEPDVERDDQGMSLGMVRWDDPRRTSRTPRSP